jgi:hypothetical protein
MAEKASSSWLPATRSQGPIRAAKVAWWLRALARSLRADSFLPRESAGHSSR